MQFCHLPLFLIIAVVCLFFGLNLVIGGSLLIYEASNVTSFCEDKNFSSIHASKNGRSLDEYISSQDEFDEKIPSIEDQNRADPSTTTTTTKRPPPLQYQVHTEDMCKAALPMLGAGILVLLNGLAHLALGIFYIAVFACFMDTGMYLFITVLFVFLVLSLIAAAVILAYQATWDQPGAIFVAVVCALDLVACAVSAVLLAIYNDKDLDEIRCRKRQNNNNSQADWTRRVRRRPNPGTGGDNRSKGSGRTTLSSKSKVRFQLPPKDWRDQPHGPAVRKPTSNASVAANQHITKKPSPPTGGGNLRPSKSPGSSNTNTNLRRT